ncbi:GNAT family N-acetyltransferase [Halomonas sp. McH1-25]|uniref:GNAT family N-acetyltransferase n=1 Tax=unclassified Halomonas TaxID=2609666 RepID=UPI001EF5AA38|nr:MULTISPECIES: GNAT family N-acetyltransferase [unclassified Halomonas]MCG7598243.1 GNAT family N-acetyltransferase [Halomonas sp. McH1-25]MCP1340974.1 GNAT family N-acetyltransferase [Halomonas sp. FL8]MCP1361458.1 GNAT family N-acetyltransferase [Halomonas sp. BBD45]MCP1363943.1 GNAT family N-acetyltransferase [Halomonas sp. BBD48]
MKEYLFREARSDDLAALVEMLADDELGQSRELPGTPLNYGYAAAFKSIQNDPNNELIICESDGQVLGMLQITFIPYLTYIGGWRALIEGVRVASSKRGEGVGAKLLEWAIQRAKEKGCLIVQLTSDKKRPDAIRFYEKLGFSASHEGMKLWLN